MEHLDTILEQNKMLIAALQWLLDDLHDCNETTSVTGEIFDSVLNAGKALKACGGKPPFDVEEMHD